MTDEEWDRRRDRAISAVFQTGRSVFADTEGELRYVDGDREPLADDVGVPRIEQVEVAVKLTWWARLRRLVGGRS